MFLNRNVVVEVKFMSDMDMFGQLSQTFGFTPDHM